MTTSDSNSNHPGMSRRRMLQRLGIAATALYAVPVLLQLSEARASGGSRRSVSRRSFSRPSLSRDNSRKGSRRRKGGKSFSRD